MFAVRLCFRAQSQLLLSLSKFTPFLSCFAAVAEFDVFHFVVVFVFVFVFFFFFCTKLTQLPVWPSDKQLCEPTRRAEREWKGGCSAVDVCLCLCVFVSMHSHAALNLSLLVPSGHISCNRPSVKARQLTIRGGGGGDYTRGLVSYTITSHIHWQAWELVYQHSFVCVCVYVLKDMNIHKDRRRRWYSPKKTGGKTKWAQTERERACREAEEEAERCS